MTKLKTHGTEVLTGLQWAVVFRQVGEAVARGYRNGKAFDEADNFIGAINILATLAEEDCFAGKEITLDGLLNAASVIEPPPRMSFERVIEILLHEPANNEETI